MRVTEAGDRQHTNKYEVVAHSFGSKRLEQVVSALDNLLNRNQGMPFTLKDLLHEALCFSEFPVEDTTLKIALRKLHDTYQDRLVTRMGRAATYTLVKQ